MGHYFLNTQYTEIFHIFESVNFLLSIEKVYCIWIWKTFSINLNLTGSLCTLFIYLTYQLRSKTRLDIIYSSRWRIWPYGAYRASLARHIRRIYGWMEIRSVFLYGRSYLTLNFRAFTKKTSKGFFSGSIKLWCVYWCLFSTVYTELNCKKRLSMSEEVWGSRSIHQANLSAGIQTNSSRAKQYQS